MINKEIEIQEYKITDLEPLIKRANKYIDLREINAYILRELISVIYVDVLDKSSGERELGIGGISGPFFTHAFRIIFRY